MKSLRTYYLYTLNDPFTNEIRYVGITCNMENRLKEHISDKAITKKTKWIGLLKSQNALPVITEVKSTKNVKEVIQWEIDTIAEYSKIYSLTNSTMGGEYYGIGTPVSVYTLDGEFIDTFTSMIEAAEYYELSENAVSGISACCLHKRNYAYEKIWRYVDEGVTKAQLDKVKSSLESKKEKHFFAISIDGKTVKEFECVQDSENFFTSKRARIYEALKAGNTGKTVNGYFICREKEDYNIQKQLYDKNLPKKVNQYDLNCNFIKTYDSLSDAARQLNCSGNINVIRGCCEGKYKQGLGYIWRYEGSKLPLVSVTNTKRKKSGNKSKVVYQYDLSDNFIKKYNSSIEAAYELGIKCAGTINECARGRKKTAGGYKWSYNGPVTSNSN